MKKITFVILMMLATSLYAKPIIINQSPKTSVMMGFTLAVQRHLGVESKFYQSRDCQDAARAYSKNDDSIIVYATDIPAAANPKGLECEVEFTKNEVVLFTWQSFEICHLPENTTALHDSETFGMSGMHPHNAWISEFNDKFNNNLRTRIFSGSGATAKGLIAKDIDWGFIASAVASPLVEKGTLVCPYTTDPNSPNYFGNSYSISLADLRIKVLVLARGADVELIREGLKNTDFERYLHSSGYSHIQHEMNDSQFEEFMKDYELLQQSYD
jgi:hypothetical protein